MIIQEAKRQKLEIDKNLIQERLNELKASFGSEEAFNDSLLAQGLSLAEVEEDISGQLMMRDIVEQEVRNKIFLHPQEVTDYYNNNPQEFSLSEGLDIESIFIANKATELLTKNAVDEVTKAIAEGKDFLELAKKYSESEPLGVIRRGQLKKEIEDVIFDLAVNQASLPLKTEKGYFIFKLKEKVPPKQIEFNDVKDQIYQMLFGVKFQERFLEWIEGLKKNAYILIK